MADDKDEERPEPRDKVISARVSPEVHRKARERARQEGRSLSAILRAWLLMFADDETPSPPKMPDEDRRAKKRSGKKK